MEKSKTNMEKSKEHAEKSKAELKKSKDELEKDLKQSASNLKSKSEDSYNRIITRLDRERKHITNEIDKDYREARRYVRSNPEEGVLMAFAGGLAIGLLLGVIKK